MKRIHAIALTAFREAIRDRILVAVLGLGVASVLFGLGLGAVSYGEAVRILVNHGLVTISWLANVIAIFLGANFLYKEIELRTLYVILAKPVARHEVVIGKYVGILITAAVFILLTATFLLVLATMIATDEVPQAALRAGQYLGPQLRLVRSRGTRAAAVALVVLAGLAVVAVPRVRRALSVTTLLPIAAVFYGVVSAIAWLVVPREAVFVLAGSALVFAEVAITAAFAIFFSSFSTPFVTGMMTAGTFAIARSSWLMQHINPGPRTATLKSVLERVAWVVPNLHLFVPQRFVLASDDPLRPSAALYVAHAGVYAVLYGAVILAAAALLFRKRDLV